MKENFSIVFIGKLVLGEAKDKVIQDLAKITRKDPEWVEKYVFSGKPVVLTKKNDRKSAEAALANFQKVGLEVVLQENNISDVDKTTPPVETKSPIKDEKKTTSPGKKKRTFISKKLIFAGVAFLLLASVAGGGYWWLQKKVIHMDVPESLMKAEDALATENLIFMGHANISKGVELEKLLFGDDDQSPLMTKWDQSFVGRLIQMGIKPREHLKQILFALNLGDNDNAHYSAILFGNFPSDRVIDFLKKEYLVEDLDVGGGKGFIITKQDVDTCVYTPKRAIFIESNQIVLSGPDNIKTLLKRLKTPPAKKGFDLSQWRAYRSKNLLSMALFAPQHSEKAVDGIMRMMLTGMKESFKPVDSVYLGARPQMVPPGLNVNLELNSKDPSWLSSNSKKWKEALEEKKRGAGYTLSSATKVLDYIQISNTESKLVVALTLNKELGDDITGMVGEVVGSIFQFSGGRGSQGFGGGSSQTQEQLEEKPTPYLAHYSENKLKPFNPELDQNFKA